MLTLYPIAPCPEQPIMTPFDVLLKSIEYSSYSLIKLNPVEPIKKKGYIKMAINKESFI